MQGERHRARKVCARLRAHERSARGVRNRSGTTSSTGAGRASSTQARELQRASLEMPHTRLLFQSQARDKLLRGVVARMRAGQVGFDAATGAYVDLFAAGIIDPAKVVRCALENAVSVAGTLLLTEATMIEVSEPEKKGHAGASEEAFD